MFEKSERARRTKALILEAWNVTLEGLRWLWEHCKRVSRTPRRLFGWALKDPGKLKVVQAQAGPPPAPPDTVAPAKWLDDSMGILAGRFRLPAPRTRSPFAEDRVDPS